jgi:hypothetical protein
MGIRRYVVAVLTVSLFGLGQPSADPAPGWAVLKISRVQVKPRKIDGSTWDLSNERKSADCGAVAMIGKMAGGMAGGLIATMLCSHSKPGQRDVSAPDLFVQLVADDARYRTPVALDTYAEAFDFPWSFPSRGFHPPGSRSRYSTRTTTSAQVS